MTRQFDSIEIDFHGLMILRKEQERQEEVLIFVKPAIIDVITVVFTISVALDWAIKAH